MEQAPKEAGKEVILNTSRWFCFGEKEKELWEGVRETRMQVRWFCEGAKNTYFIPHSLSGLWLCRSILYTLVVFSQGSTAWVGMETVDTWIGLPPGGLARWFGWGWRNCACPFPRLWIPDGFDHSIILFWLACCLACSQHVHTEFILLHGYFIFLLG